MANRICALLLLLLVTLTTGLGVSGCGSEAPLRPATTDSSPQAPASGEWAIRVYAEVNGQEQLLELPPIPELSWPDAESMTQESAADVYGPGLSAKAETKPSVSAAGWALLQATAMECGVRSPPLDPWYPVGTFFVFDNPPATCDEALEDQVVLLCMVDHLMSVADNVGVLNWEQVDWRVPPQRSQDKFIVLDLAAFVLAHLAVFDNLVFPQPGIDATATCTELYAMAVEGSTSPALFDCNALEACSLPPKEPIVTPADAIRFAKARLIVKAHVLRDAARKLETVVRSSVQGDLAAAEQRRERMADPAGGRAMYWGMNKRAGDAPIDGSPDARAYGSLAHAMRVIVGRWEHGALQYAYPTATGGVATYPGSSPNPGVPPAFCGGVMPLELLATAYGPDLSARYNARDLNSKDQESAVRLIENSGIVIPKARLDLDDAAFDSQVRPAIEKQLVLRGATAQGFGGSAARVELFATHGRGQSIRAGLQRVSNADLRFALLHALHTYMMLANEGESTSLSSAALAGGVAPAAEVAPELSQLGGIQLARGLPRGDLGSDATSRAGGLQESSQCRALGGVNAMLEADAGFRYAFQDSFAMGQLFQKRLVKLREAAEGADLTGPEDAGPIASAAVAEIRTWAGPGQIVATRTSGKGSPGARIVLHTLGFQPKDWGVETPAQMLKEVVLVWGEPWVAECAAKRRSTCPANFDHNYVVRPIASTSTMAWVTDSESARFGADGTYGTLTFPASNARKFKPTVLPDISSGPSDKHLYVVLLQDPEQPAARGTVLGALALRTVGGATALAVSDLQRELIDRVLGVDKLFSLDGLRIGMRGMSFGHNCLPNAPRWVPLENELNNDSDQYENSWKHYLTMAKQASQKADELAQKIIDLGLQQDFRREAAMEEIAGICGEYGALEDLDIIDGQVVASGTKDSTLQSCLSPTKKNIVFLTQDQAETPSLFGAPSDDPQAFLRDLVMQCAKHPEHHLCQKDANGHYVVPEISHSGLNITEAKVPAARTSSCEPEMYLVRTLGPGFSSSTGMEVSTKGWLGDGQLRVLVNSIWLKSWDHGGDWALYAGSGRVMDSRAPEFQIPESGSTLGSAGAEGPEVVLWPGCLRTQCPDDVQVQQLDDIFHKGLRAQLEFGDLAKELAVIRWRVEGALWTLGAMAGGIHENMFKKPIPAANFNVIASAPVHTIYGTSRFAAVSGSAECAGNPSYDLMSESGADRAVLGIGCPIPSLAYPSGGEIPEPLPSIYAAPSGYLHVLAGSHEIGFSHPQFSAAAFVKKRSTELHNMECRDGNGIPRYHGMGQIGTPANQLEAARRLAELRGRVSTPYDRTQQWLCSFPAAGEALVVESAVDGSPTTVLWDALGPDFVESFSIESLVPGFPYGDDGQLSDSYPYSVPLDFNYFWHPFAVSTSRSDWSSVPRDYVVDERGWTKFDWVLLATLSGRYTRRHLLPQFCSPDDRLPAFVNSYAANGTCGAAAQLVQSLALGCLLGNRELVTVDNEPPPIDTLESIPLFVSWIDRQADRATYAVSSLYLEDLPEGVVDDFREGRVGSGNSNGEHGRIELLMEGSLNSLVTGWIKVEDDLRQLGLAVDSANNMIAGAQLSEESKLRDFALRKMQVHMQIVQAVAAEASAMAPGISVGTDTSLSWSTAAGANASAAHESISIGQDELRALDDMEALASEEKANEIAQIFIEFEQTTSRLYEDLETTLLAIRTSVADLLGLASELRQAEAKAKYEAAKGLGEDYVSIDGEIVDFPVNTVLRREYDITLRRYKAALDEAKYLAYAARLAIEQRIGQRLSTLEQKVGPQEAPREWADDVCTLQGVNYEELKSFYDHDAGAAPSDDEEAAAIAEFADQYIGDYVSKLESFVDYYNIEYPSHDGDDTAVLSLRQDLLPARGTCIGMSPNLLYYSADLAASDVVADGDEVVIRGWQYHRCDHEMDRCLRVASAAALAAPANPPPGHPGGSVTWLFETPVVTELPDGLPPSPDTGADAGGGGDAASQDPDATLAQPQEGGAPAAGAQGPARTVWQTIRLETGSYLLSWWEQARGSDGALSEDGSPSTLQAGVYDEEWVPVAPIFSDQPHSACAVCAGEGAPCGSCEWGDRRELPLSVSGGVYHVAFSISDNNEAPGSVAIANVQLESTTSSVAPAGPYVATNSSREHVTSNCSDQGAQALQGAFEYRCEPATGCFYELRQPIYIDTSLQTEQSRLARGNFNYRHITLALNLVGTGVRDCTQTPNANCYGSGFVEYTLTHDASHTGILGRDGETVQYFNFGSAGINHAKALTTERLITMPTSSADGALLEQPGIEKAEFRGRPLDGSYRLRIWDEPALVWGRLEDIQMIFKYRYWSAIQGQQH